MDVLSTRVADILEEEDAHLSRLALRLVCTELAHRMPPLAKPNKPVISVCDLPLLRHSRHNCEWTVDESDLCAAFLDARWPDAFYVFIFGCHPVALLHLIFMLSCYPPNPFQWGDALARFARIWWAAETRPRIRLCVAFFTDRLQTTGLPAWLPENFLVLAYATGLTLEDDFVPALLEAHHPFLDLVRLAYARDQGELVLVDDDGN